MIIITVLAGVLSVISGNIYVERAFAGIRIAVAAQILVSVCKLAKKALISVNTVIVAIVGFLSLFLFGLSPVLITACAIAYGILLYFLRRKDNASA